MKQFGLSLPLIYTFFSGKGFKKIVVLVVFLRRIRHNEQITEQNDSYWSLLRITEYFSQDGKKSRLFRAKLRKNIASQMKRRSSSVGSPICYSVHFLKGGIYERS